MMNRNNRLRIKGFTSKFELAFNVNKSVKEVYEIISSPDSFVAIHPLIYKISEPGKGSWHVFEKLHFAGVPFSFNYPVIINCDVLTHNIVMNAVVMNVIGINLSFKLDQNQDHTIVKEQIVINSLFPVHPFVKQVFKKQHKILFEKINSD